MPEYPVLVEQPVLYECSLEHNVASVFKCASETGKIPDKQISFPFSKYIVRGLTTSTPGSHDKSTTTTNLSAISLEGALSFLLQ